LCLVRQNSMYCVQSQYHNRKVSIRGKHRAHKISTKLQLNNDACLRSHK
jgi:hypothetical protein